MTYEAIIDCCQDLFLKAWSRPCQVASEKVEICNALASMALPVLCHMQTVERMGKVGLGHMAGPQVRLLMEAATVACALRLGKTGLAEQVKRDRLSTKDLQESRKFIAKHFDERGYQTDTNIKERWDMYNTLAHYNRHSLLPERSPAVVRDGIAFGVMVFAEFAVFLKSESDHGTDDRQLEIACLEILGKRE